MNVNKQRPRQPLLVEAHVVLDIAVYWVEVPKCTLGEAAVQCGLDGAMLGQKHTAGGTLQEGWPEAGLPRTLCLAGV